MQNKGILSLYNLFSNDDKFIIIVKILKTKEENL
jgi:hypothetical protein